MNDFKWGVSRMLIGFGVCGVLAYFEAPLWQFVLALLLLWGTWFSETLKLR